MARRIRDEDEPSAQDEKDQAYAEGLFDALVPEEDADPEDGPDWGLQDGLLGDVPAWFLTADAGKGEKPVALVLTPRVHKLIQEGLKLLFEGDEDDDEDEDEEPRKRRRGWKP